MTAKKRLARLDASKRLDALAELIDWRPDDEMARAGRVVLALAYALKKDDLKSIPRLLSEAEKYLRKPEEDGFPAVVFHGSAQDAYTNARGAVENLVSHRERFNRRDVPANRRLTTDALAAHVAGYVGQVVMMMQPANETRRQAVIAAIAALGPKIWAPETAIRAGLRAAGIKLKEIDLLEQAHEKRLKRQPG